MRALRGSEGIAMTSAGRTELTHQQLDALARDFLRSEFADQTYSVWPIDRRVDAYLHHRGRDDLLNDGGACDALLELDHKNSNIHPPLLRTVSAGWEEVIPLQN